MCTMCTKRIIRPHNVHQCSFDHNCHPTIIRLSKLINVFENVCVYVSRIDLLVVDNNVIVIVVVVVLLDCVGVNRHSNTK